MAVPEKVPTELAALLRRMVAIPTSTRGLRRAAVPARHIQCRWACCALPADCLGHSQPCTKLIFTTHWNWHIGKPSPEPNPISSSSLFIRRAVCCNTVGVLSLQCIAF